MSYSETVVVQPHREAERARLVGFMDSYLAAFRAKDFRALRVAPNLKNTDNGVSLPVGSGLVKTVDALRPGGQYFVDVDAGQVEYWGVVDQMGEGTIYGVRLRVEGTLISEIETLAVRNTDPYYFPDVILADDEAFHAILPETERASRAALVGVAHSYFNAIERNDGTLVPVRDDCPRLVNGAEDTLTDVSELGRSEAHRALTVQQQITDGHYAYIEGLRERRFPIVDEERGLVLAHVLFDHPGNIAKPSGDIPLKHPNSMLAYEVFKIRAGEVIGVWAICYSVPYGMSAGW